MGQLCQCVVVCVDYSLFCFSASNRLTICLMMSWYLLYFFSYYKYSQTCIKRSQFGQSKSCLIKQVTIHMTGHKKVTFEYRWLLNREDHMGRFDCICKATPWPSTYIWITYTINFVFLWICLGFFVKCCQIIKRKTWLSTTVGGVFREYVTPFIHLRPLI
jgi:hypothetical protein